MAKELFASRLKKVVPFEQDGSFFYRKARKYIENNNYIHALNYYRKAVEKDPDNLEYSLDLAEIFSEMGYFHESNLIHFFILQRDPTRASCYFSIGCNFLGMQEYAKAEHSLVKYLELDEFGFYSEEARNLLEVLQSQEFYLEFINDIDPNSDKSFALASKGKDFLDRGDYKRAVLELERATRQDPSLIFARNNLALAYFCADRLDKAIEVCRDILENYPSNIHANCNMTLFLYEKGDIEGSNRHLETVLSIKTDDPEEMHKIAVTLCEIGEHKKVNQLLKKLLQYKPYDTNVLHYMAVSCYNLKQFNTAYKYWDKVEKINPNNTISSYYKYYVKGVMNNDREFSELPYHFQVPYDEIIRRIKTIHDLLKLPGTDLRNKWRNGDDLASLLRWGLNLNDVMIKKAILNVVASFRDDRAEQFLRTFVLGKTEQKELIQEALALLKEMDAKEPYLAYIDDDIVEVNINQDNSSTKEYVLAKIPEMVIKRLKSSYLHDCEENIRDIWGYVIAHWNMVGMPQIRKPHGWAAALELFYRIKENLPVNKTELAASWNISYSTMMRNYHFINQLVDEFWKQMNY